MDLSCLNTIHLLLTGISTGLVNNKKSYYTFIYKYNTILYMINTFNITGKLTYYSQPVYKPNLAEISSIRLIGFTASLETSGSTVTSGNSYLRQL